MGKVFNPINTTYIKGSGSGTTDYNDLDNKPLINGVELVGDKTLKNLGIDLDEYYTKSETYSKQEVDNALNEKQDLLESGINIKAINGISLLGRGNIDIDPGPTYTAGDGIDITNDVISADDTIARKSNYYTKTEVTSMLNNKQDTLVTGTNIKTINGLPVLGSGNIEISTPEATDSVTGTVKTNSTKNITFDTAFAVGNGIFNGNGNITRSNAFEVKTDGSIVLKSPNGTKYKIAVADDGTLTTTAI